MPSASPQRPIEPPVGAMAHGPCTKVMLMPLTTYVYAPFRTDRPSSSIVGSIMHGACGAVHGRSCDVARHSRACLPSVRPLSSVSPCASSFGKARNQTGHQLAGADDTAYSYVMRSLLVRHASCILLQDQHGADDCCCGTAAFHQWYEMRWHDDESTTTTRAGSQRLVVSFGQGWRLEWIGSSARHARNHPLLASPIQIDTMMMIRSID